MLMPITRDKDPMAHGKFCIGMWEVFALGDTHVVKIIFKWKEKYGHRS